MTRPGLREEPRPAAPGAAADPLYVAYHDEEWGVPAHDDRRLFEMLVLEGAQAGLSWITVLRKREAYRRAFAGFDPAAVAGFGPERVAASSRTRASCATGSRWPPRWPTPGPSWRSSGQFGSFDAYLWRGRAGARVNRWRAQARGPGRDPRGAAR